MVGQLSAFTNTKNPLFMRFVNKSRNKETPGNAMLPGVLMGGLRGLEPRTR